MRKALALTSAGAAAVGIIGLGSHKRWRRMEVRRLRRMSHYWHGRTRGMIYHLAGRHPSGDVDDHTLADRIRSELGPLEKRYDIPHVHVMVEGGTVLLHGEVAAAEERAHIEGAVLATPGVRSIDSHLHLGLLPSDTRPSAGKGYHRHP